jgi:hypothetical protein
VLAKVNVGVKVLVTVSVGVLVQFTDTACRPPAANSLLKEPVPIALSGLPLKMRNYVPSSM